MVTGAAEQFKCPECAMDGQRTVECQQFLNKNLEERYRTVSIRIGTKFFRYLASLKPKLSARKLKSFLLIP